MSIRKDERGPSGLRAITVGGSLGIALIAVVAVIWLWGAVRDDLPPLTQAELDAAAKVWTENGPSNYALIIDVGGQREGVVQLRVQDGQVVEFSRDGYTPNEPRTWQVWSVAGQFDMIRRELAIANDPTGEAGAARGTRHVLGAEFDAELGWVRRFRRAVVGGGTGISWSVRAFTPLPADN